MSIGETLAAARQDAGLTIVDVSRSTRIRETIISGIERDDFSLCGGDFYARGHIRSLAQVIGIDPRPLVDQYDEEHGGSPRAIPPTAAVGSGSVSTEPRRPRLNVSMVMAVLLFVVVVFGVFQLVSGLTGSSGSAGSRDAGGQQPRSVAQATDSRSPAPERTAAPEPSKTRASEPPPEPDKASVRLVARARTWISVEGSGGEQIYSGMLYSGDTKRFTDEKIIRLEIGNLGGVSLTINGKNFGVVGEPGAVDDLRVYPDRVDGIS